MRIGIIGANGRVGSRIATEAVNRRHQVTAIVRNAEKINNPALSVIEKDIFSLTASDLAPFDAIVSAFGTSTEQSHLFVETTKHLISLLKGKETPRLLFLGGAGSLFVDTDGTELCTIPQFPKEYKAIATAMRDALLFLRTVTNVNWIFLSPSARFEPGERTGRFRIGKDHLLTNEQGESYISMEDYAIAMLDEIETPKHIKERFTVGY